MKTIEKVGKKNKNNIAPNGEYKNSRRFGTLNFVNRINLIKI